jgi:hypothetical protein
MSPELVKELVGLFARYIVPAIVAALAHYLSEKDQAALTTILTSNEMLAIYAASLASLCFGIKSWLSKTRFGLTAAAMPTTSTPAEVAAVSKVQAPVLSTPTNTVPQLTPYKE